MYKMISDDFETVYEEERPSTPETMPRRTSPPRRIRRCGQLPLDTDLYKKYLNIEIQNENLNNELLNYKNENEKLKNTIKAQKKLISCYNFRLTTIQEILFENSESIIEWVYIQLMNSMVASLGNTN